MNRTYSLMAGAAAAALLAAAATAQAEPVRGGVVVMGIAEESRGMDPLTAHRRFSEAAIHVHDGLMIADAEGRQFGQLATGFEVNEDATEYVITLRDDVIFHDGSRFTGADVAAHFERVFDPQFCCNNAYQYLGPYSGTELIDDHTVRVTFSSSWGPFAHYIGLLDVTGIPSNASWEEKGMEMNRTPVGAGPFRFVEWVPQSHARFERFEEYNWGSEMLGHTGAPFVDAVEVRFIADQATRTACLESGDCNIIKAPGFADIARLERDPRFEVDRIPQTGMPFSFNFNTNKWPTNQLPVRQAINLAIDREKINFAAFMGQRIPMYTNLSPATPEFLPEMSELIYFDPDEARAILADAGFGDSNGNGILDLDGQPLAIDLYVFGGREANPSIIVAESIQSDLREVGIDVNIIVQPWDQQSVVAMRQQHHMINFDMPLPTASVLGVLFNSRETPREGHYGMGFTWFQEAEPELSAELDRVLDAADNAAAMEDRMRYFHEAQRIIGTNFLGVPISQGYTFYVRVAEMQGVAYNDGGHALFNATHFEN